MCESRCRKNAPFGRRQQAFRCGLSLKGHDYARDLTRAVFV
jgi:hypothetical protein